MTTSQFLGEDVKTRRLALRLSVSQLASSAEVSVPLLEKIEGGRYLTTTSPKVSRLLACLDDLEDKCQ